MVHTHGFGIVSAGVFGGRLRQNTASGEDELCQVVCLIVSRSEDASLPFFQGDSDTEAKQYSLVAKKMRNIRKVLREDDVDPLIHTQSWQPLENSSRMEPTPPVLSSCAHWVTRPQLRCTISRGQRRLHFAMRERSVVDPLTSYWGHRMEQYFQRQRKHLAPTDNRVPRCIRVQGKHTGVPRVPDNAFAES